MISDLCLPIQKDRGHQVCQDGPYKIVRHPGYVGVILMALGIPIALGSLWGLIPGILTVVLIVYRTVMEDRTLQQELPGYKEYAQKVRYLLIPRIW